eukprot:scaffold480_cov257-Pinguiococcus_pyrenoidosus.AAC.18
MAPLIVAGRRYLVSSDDVAPGLGLAVLLRALWIIALVWVLRGLIRSVGDCRDIWLFWLYLWLSLAVYVGALLLQIAALRVSLRGTLVQPQKRAFVGKAFVSLALLSAAQLLLAIFGLVLAVGQAPVCAKEVEEAISRSENGVEVRRTTRRRTGSRELRALFLTFPTLPGTAKDPVLDRHRDAARGFRNLCGASFGPSPEAESSVPGARKHEHARAGDGGTVSIVSSNHLLRDLQPVRRWARRGLSHGRQAARYLVLQHDHGPGS